MKTKEELRRLKKLIKVPKEDEILEDSKIDGHLPEKFYEEIYLLEDEFQRNQGLPAESMKKLIGLYMEGINIYQNREDVFKIKSFELKLKKLLQNEDINKVLYQLEKNNFEDNKPDSENEYYEENLKLVEDIHKTLKENKKKFEEDAKTLAEKLKEDYLNDLTKFQNANDILESEIKKQKSEAEELYQNALEKQKESEVSKSVTEIISQENQEEDLAKRKESYKNKLHEYMPKLKEKIDDYVTKYNTGFFNDCLVEKIDLLDEAIVNKFKERENVITYYDNLLRDIELEATENDDVEKVKEMMDEEKELQLFHIEDEFSKIKEKEINKMKDYGIKQTSPLFLLNEKLKCEVFDSLTKLDENEESSKKDK